MKNDDTGPESLEAEELSPLDDSTSRAGEDMLKSRRS
jgi:hypothetical protein